MARTTFKAASASLALALGAIGLAACSSSTSSQGTGTSASCDKSALQSASGTIQLNFWESMPRANGQALQALTDKFNASQSKVHVNLVEQTTYQDTFNKVISGLSTGQLPDIAQLTDTDTQAAIDTKAFMPVQSCISAQGYSTSDFLPRALAYWKIGGTQWAMPFGVSNPVLFYNKKAFAAAGIASPPATLSQLVGTSKALVAKGQGGLGLVIDPWHFETWLATANSLYANNQNGRDGAATAVSFNDTVGQTVFTDLSELVGSGAATTNSSSGADRYNDLLGVGSGKFSMAIDTSAALGTVEQVLSTGQYPNVELGVAPFPVYSTSIKGGIQPAGNGLWISAKSSAAKRAAAWEYISFLDSSASMATWAVSTGYIPIRTTSASSAAVQALWAKDPSWKVAYNQLQGGVNDAATSGAVIGPFNDVHQAVTDAESSMFVNHVAPKTALATAASKADAAISSYNQRLGGG
jgi:sn-glycerol 3-phosphate transport system substrate-binding protein